MPLPVEDEAPEQVGAAEEGAVFRRRPADDDMVAAAGPGMTAVDHELVRPEARLARLFVDGGRRLDAVAPACGGMDVDLDDAGIGPHLDDVEARVVRRRIALDADRHADTLGGGLDRRDQLEIVLDPFDRRHEDAELAVARLDGNGGAHRSADRIELLLDAVLARGRVGAEGGGRLLAALGGLGHPLGHARVERRLAGIGQLPARHRRIERHHIGKIGRRHVRQRAERQTVADRRIAGDQEQPAAPRLPLFGPPARAVGAGPASAGWAGRSRSARSARARKPARSGSALPGRRAWNWPGRHCPGSLPSFRIHSPGSS